jgi:hypothetical protein
MPEDLYARLHNRVGRRLSRTPYWATLNALLFTLFSTLFGLFGLLSSPQDGAVVVYCISLIWSLDLFAHVALLYRRSGARRATREKTIYEEVRDADDFLKLDADELVDLHSQLSNAIQRESWAFGRLMRNAWAYLLLWPGSMLALILITTLVSPQKLDGVFEVAFILALLGTFLLGFTLPVRQLFRRQNDLSDLHALYGAKPKRQITVEGAKAKRPVRIGDDGELVLEVGDNGRAEHQEKS